MLVNRHGPMKLGNHLLNLMFIQMVNQRVFIQIGYQNDHNLTTIYNTRIFSLSMNQILTFIVA